MNQRLFYGIKKETSSLYPVTLLSTKKTIERIDSMSHSYFTRKLLTIKDKNIYFPPDYLKEVNLNGLTSFILKGFYPINLLIASAAELFLILNLKSIDSKRLEL